MPSVRSNTADETWSRSIPKGAPSLTAMISNAPAIWFISDSRSALPIWPERTLESAWTAEHCMATS